VYALPQHDDIISSSVAYQRHDALFLSVPHPSHAEAIVPNDDHIAAAANVQALANLHHRPPNPHSAKSSLSVVSFPTEGVPARSIADTNTRGDSIVRSRTREGFISVIQDLKNRRRGPIAYQDVLRLLRQMFSSRVCAVAPATCNLPFTKSAPQRLFGIVRICDYTTTRLSLLRGHPVFPGTYYYQPRHTASRMELYVFFFRSRCEGDLGKERKWVRVKIVTG
jgi:hypothetical protein